MIEQIFVVLAIVALWKVMKKISTENLHYNIRNARGRIERAHAAIR